MDTFLAVVGWILWGWILLWGLGAMASRPSNEQWTRSVMNVQAFILLGACAATLLLPVSKLWLLAVPPAALLLPMLLLSMLGARASAKIQDVIQRVKRESEATGVPVAELLERETERLQGRKPRG